MKKMSRDDLQRSNGSATQLDLICMSHLRWNFVYQRPQHLLSRAAKQQRVFFFEEPLYGDYQPHLEVRKEPEGLFVAVPRLPHNLNESEQNQLVRDLLEGMIEDYAIDRFVAWYYTPMALKFARDLQPALCVYDCMDQLSHFKGASREIPLLELELLQRADLVFTGGQSLFESKRDMHSDVHAFPSSVDVSHFIQARHQTELPVEQHSLKGITLGYLGVIDERIDIDLIAGIAAMRPDWQILMIGPVVKIDEAHLPRLPNIHYFGPKSYAELPHYLSGWDYALLPFARNDATRFISPTKTPEYLAAGRRVISTSIRDVVKPYGERQMVTIADTAAEFVAAVERDQAMSPNERRAWLGRVDSFLASQSWQQTFEGMWQLMEQSLQRIHDEDQTQANQMSRKSELFTSDRSRTAIASSAIMSRNIALSPG